MLEASVRPLLRGRYRAVAGFLDLASDSLRTNIPLPRRGLPRKGELCLSGTGLTFDDDWTIEAGGHLDAEDHSGPLRLAGHAVHADATSVVVWARGKLLTRPIRFELAAEFSR
ncbi:hypothetical protein ACPZ19_21845 [Amycolatopsis lurida]